MRYIVLLTASDGTKNVVGVFNDGFSADRWIERAADRGINADEGIDVETLMIGSKDLDLNI